ncbi:MAG: alpha/beta fold hydrolase [Cyanobacteriota bacterium]
MILVGNSLGHIDSINTRNVGKHSYIVVPSNTTNFQDVFIRQESGISKPKQVSFLGLKKYIEQKYIFKPRKDEEILDLDILYKFKEVDVNTIDNLILKCWFVKPKPGKPTILFCHGQNCNVTHHQDIVKFLYNNGYGGLLVDYRGFRKNPGEPSEHGLYNDAKAALAYLQTKGIKNSDIIIWGHSMGGGVASEMAYRGNYKGLILESTFAGIEDMKNHYLSPDFVKDKPLKTRVLICLLKLLPDKFLELDTKFDNKRKIKTVNYPILIVHSKEDKKVPVQMSHILAAWQPKANFVLFDKGNHADHTWAINTINGFIKGIS